MNYKCYFIKVPPHILLWVNCKTRRAWELGLNIWHTIICYASSSGKTTRNQLVTCREWSSAENQRSRDFLTSSLCFIQGSGVCYHDNKLQLPWQPQCFTTTSFSKWPPSHDSFIDTLAEFIRAESDTGAESGALWLNKMIKTLKQLSNLCLHKSTTFWMDLGRVTWDLCR